MTLVTLRQKFVEISGRYDLVVDTSAWADNGADFFIQAGQNTLDQKVSSLPESEGRIYETLAASGHYVSFQKRCRAIIQVWANNDENRVELEKVPFDDLRNLYGDIIADIDTGAPLYYSPAKLREIDVTDQNATGTFVNYTLSTSTDFRGIIIMPPVDEAYDIEILGKFHQLALTVDAQENFWTIMHPFTLIKAALYHLEVGYRNSEGQKDWMNAINLDVVEIDMDIVEEEIATTDTMGDK